MEMEYKSKEKNQTLLTYGCGSNREPSRDPYQSIDLIEYHKRLLGKMSKDVANRRERARKSIFNI
jgi:hypothetical protein